MEILGFAGALMIGFALGIVGGGGSVLTVPVLAYFFSVEPVLATAYSLFIVGIAALAGAIKNMQQGFVSYKIAIVFSIPSLIAVFITRRYLLPAIPSVIIDSDMLWLTKDMAVMLLFGLLMIASSVFMLREKSEDAGVNDKNSKHLHILYVIPEGIFVGIITGLVGAGGGFLIVPALVLLAKLPMKVAVGSSLFIIALKSMIGFLGDVGVGRAIDWPFLAVISALVIAGVLAGNYASRFIAAGKLKTGFGWVIMGLGITMIVHELFL